MSACLTHLLPMQLFPAPSPLRFSDVFSGSGMGALVKKLVIIFDSFHVFALHYAYEKILKGAISLLIFQTVFTNYFLLSYENSSDIKHDSLDRRWSSF